MKMLLAVLLPLGFAALPCGGATPEPQEWPEPYQYCNVFTSRACFGIIGGDKLGMEIVMDFVIHSVSFPSGRTATIYSGYHPSLSDRSGARFEKCAEPKGFPDCRRRNLDDGGVELIVRAEENGHAFHVTVSPGTKGAANIESFLRNIKPCRRIENTLQCAP
jgi:hypothetical protein